VDPESGHAAVRRAVVSWGNVRQLRKRREHAEREGAAAYASGASRRANPYRNVPGERMERWAWDRGFMAAALAALDAR